MAQKTFRNQTPIYLPKHLQHVPIVVQSHVWLFATSRTAACQASLSFTSSQSLLKLMSIESVMTSNHLILCRPLLLLPSIFPSIRVFSNESYSYTSNYRNSRPLAFPQKCQASPWHYAAGRATSNAHCWLPTRWHFTFLWRPSPLPTAYTQSPPTFPGSQFITTTILYMKNI